MGPCSRSVWGSALVVVTAVVLMMGLLTIAGPVSALLWQEPGAPGALDPGAIALGLLAFLACQVHAVRGTGGFRPADAVTLLRSAMLGFFAALLPQMPEPSDQQGLSWPLVAVMIGILVMDGLDGAVARLGAGGTRAGFRYDETTDAVVMVVVSLTAALTVGWWALALGAFRPLWSLGRRLRPGWRAPLPFSRLRRVLGMLASALVLTAVSPVPALVIGGGDSGRGALEDLVRTVLVAVGLALLCFSFGRDILRLERRLGPSAQPGSAQPGSPGSAQPG